VQLSVKLEDFVRPEARNGQHLKNARRDFLAHLFKRGVGPCRVELFNDVCDGIADPGDFAQAVLRDHLVQRKAQREQSPLRGRRP
jgi:hypothetical protein